MKISRWAALTFAGLAALVAAFEIALALGAPWGEYAMGGAFPGSYPPALRAGAVVQALILALIACVVLARAGLALPRWAGLARRLTWPIVLLMGVGLLLNLITPSARERLIWAPVAALMFLASLIVARSGPAPAARPRD